MDNETSDQFAKRVADRIAKQTAGPNTASPHCWFCGKIEAWFRCDCADAIGAQQGKRNKPRWVRLKDGREVIVLDPDVIAREHNQGRKRYDAKKPAGG